MGRMDRQNTEERVVDIVEVNTSTNTVLVRDSYATLLSISLHYQDPVLTVPQIGERWTAERRGNEWFLKRKAENGTSSKPLNTLAPGDVRVEGSNIHLIGGVSVSDDLLLEGDTLTEGMISFTDDTSLERMSSGVLGVNGVALAFQSQGIPTAAIIPYAAVSAPLGWALCDGSAISRTTYATLFSLIGGSYGTGDGSTTFNLPDLRQRFPLGKAASGTGSTLAGTGGAIDHTHTGPLHSHTGPSHTHSTPNHSHSASSSATGSTTAFAAGGGGSVTDNHTHAITVNSGGGGTTGSGGTGATSSDGNGDTGTNNPPYLTLNYIIKL